MSTTLNPGAHTLATPRGRLDDGGSRTGFRRLLLGPPDQPTWARPGLLVLLVVAAILYLWDLSASGYSNSFYAAAVQAGTKNWTAFLFGSLDPGNAITVDKPPASLWVMALSGRIFGFNSWSLLVPNALEGVAAVGLLHAAVKRWSGPAAGLIAGSVFALTPVAVLMFRFDNPDSLLVLLEVAAAYCTVRATEKAGPKWLMLAGVALGFGFLTKLIQAFLVLPALALAYLIVAPAGIWRRIGHLLLAGVALVVSAGWLLVVEALWPSSSAPYIGGSTNNSLLELALGYNGLGRVFGGEGNGGGGGGGGGMGGNTMFGGSTGLFRMFGDSFGTEISWLLPAALIALVGGLWFTRWQPRTDKTRAALIIWGGWLLVTVLVFSYMQGTIHPYYTIALAPPIGALVGIGGRELWRGRDHAPARYVLAAMVAATAIWDFILLDRDSSWQPWLRWVILVAGVLVGSAIVVGAHEFRRVGAVLLAAIVFTVGAASTAWGVDTASSPHSGSIPTSGPSSSGGFGGGPGGGGFGGGSGGSGGSGGTGRRSGNADQSGFPSGATEGGRGQLPTSGSGSSGSGSGGSGSGGSGSGGSGGGNGGFTGGGGGGMGGLGDGGGSTNSALAKLLTASKTRWAAAVSGSNQAASLELDLGVSVMAMGGFTGSDPYPTLAQFKQYVADGEISYYISGGGMGGGGMGGQNSISAITSWVEQNFTASTVGGETVYKLTK